MQEPSKNHLRIALRERRQNLAPQVVREDSALIRERLLSLDHVHDARSVMLYLPARGEVDTWPLPANPRGHLEFFVERLVQPSTAGTAL